MTNSIIHRGPDDEGMYLKGNLGLGFRRLSIIDLHTGHQPLSNEDGTVWIAFNGEVYNFQELRKDLEKRGHVFRTHTDTEAIVHLYEEYGEACVEQLRGMFAFAIWDEKKQKLFCARDRFGIKPFFYYLDGDKFIFGSEIKCILASGQVDPSIDLQALDYFLTYQYTPQDRSIFQQIKKLKPSHTLSLDLSRGSSSANIRRYWEIALQPDETKSEGEWMEEIEATLSEAVKMRLVSDVPLGAFLSGGIDSSSVVALMSQFSDQPVKTFSIGFKEPEYNELPFARALAEHYQTEHHEQIVEPASIEILPELVRAYDEPFGDMSAIPTYYVSRFAREYVTVALSGDGGDELFAGYDDYPRYQKLYNFNRTPGGFNKLFWGAIHKALPTKMKGKNLTYALSHPRENIGPYWAVWTLPERAKLYHPDLWPAVAASPAEEEKVQLVREAGHPGDYVWQTQKMDMHTFLVDDILTKVDRASMWHSLEVRVPILDHKVAELSFRIPTHFKLHGDQKKYILKRTMQKYLPEAVYTHKKQGFGVPLNHWFKDDLKAFTHEKLTASHNQLSTYLNTPYIGKILQDHQTGMRDLQHKIWSLLFLEVWLENLKEEANHEVVSYT